MCSLRNWQNTFKNHTKGTTGILRAEKLYEALNDIGMSFDTILEFVIIIDVNWVETVNKFGISLHRFPTQH